MEGEESDPIYAVNQRTWVSGDSQGCNTIGLDEISTS